MLYAVSTFYFKRVSHTRSLPISLLHRHTFNGMEALLCDRLPSFKALEELRFWGKPRREIVREAMDRKLFVSDREIKIIFEDKSLKRW
jgi:hypothetical protein